MPRLDARASSSFNPGNPNDQTALMPILLMTDLHLRDPDGSHEAAAHAAQIGSCLDRAAGICPDADLCILMGDLTDDGEEGAYRWLRSKLDALPFPTVPMLGNHDDRGSYWRVFGGDCGDFVQSVQKSGDMQLMFLDTLDPGHDAGLLCPTRLEWLDRQLATARGENLCLFMHHPPCDIGDPVLDPIKLKNGDEFASVLHRHGNVTQIFFGHIHRTMFLSWNGIPCASLDSLGTPASQSSLSTMGCLERNGDGLSLLLIPMTT